MSKQIYITDNNFIYTGQQPADLDPMASKRKGRDVYTGPFPYASFDKPPEYEQDEYAILIAEQWQVKKRLAGVYYHKKTLEKLEVTDPYDGDLSDYTTIQPFSHNEGDTQVFEKGQWVLTMGEASLAAYRETLVTRANAQCQTAIFAHYPPHKQFNLLSENMHTACPDFIAMHKFITEQRATCKALKAQIAQATQDELKQIEDRLADAP